MKKVLSIPKTLCLFLLFSIFYAGCKEKDTQQSSGSNTQNANDTIRISAPIVGDTVEPINWDTMEKKIADLVAMQLQCLKDSLGYCSDSARGTTKSCKERDCSDPACNRKIVCCHTIDSITFNQMTRNGSLGHAIFPADSMRKVVNGAICGTDQIEFYINNLWYYATRVQQRAQAPGANLSYYSVALLQTILNDDKVTSVVLYRSKHYAYGKYTIPFIVYKGNVPTYYNLSDTEDK